MDLTYPCEPLKGIRSCSRSSAVDPEEANFPVAKKVTRQPLTCSLWEQRPQPENPRNGVSPQTSGSGRGSWDPEHETEVPEDALASGGGTPTHEELGEN